MLSLGNFLDVADRFLPRQIPAAYAITLFGSLVAAAPLFRLFRTQREAGRHAPAFMNNAREIVGSIFRRPHEDYQGAQALNVMPGANQDELLAQLPVLADLLRLGIPNAHDNFDNLRIPQLLISSEQNCIFPGCVDDAQQPLPLYHRQNGFRQVNLINRSHQLVPAFLQLLTCNHCHARYYPDRIVQSVNDTLVQFYIYDATYLRISKPDMLWVDRSVAIAQSQSIFQHQTFSGYANWFNKTYGPDGFVLKVGGAEEDCWEMTAEQSYRLFVEHIVREFGRRHNLPAVFQTSFDPNVQEVVRAALEWFVRDGVLPGSMAHQCENCTHIKRYRRDAAQGRRENGAAFGLAQHDEGVPRLPDLPIGPEEAALAAQGLPHIIQPQDGVEELVRAAVIDGKVTGHLLCNAPVDPPCENPPSDFKSARFCTQHSAFNMICGIVGCGRPVDPEGAVVCDRRRHREFHRDYERRFARTSIYAVRRVRERREEFANNPDAAGPLPPGPEVLQEGNFDQLEADGHVENVEHRFRAARSYCVQMISWSCGMPIAVCKFYRAESETNVFGFLNRIWPTPGLRPNYIMYDRACFLLKHIAVHHLQSSWVRTTRFVVDAWHYIGHRVTNVLCRSRCNPAPNDGSQPDLVIEDVQDDGSVHRLRAFNSEVAEQINAWLHGFKGSLNRMTDYNFDFMVYALLFLYARDWEYRKQQQEQQDARRVEREANEDEDGENE